MVPILEIFTDLSVGTSSTVSPTVVSVLQAPSQKLSRLSQSAWVEEALICTQVHTELVGETGVIPISTAPSLDSSLVIHKGPLFGMQIPFNNDAPYPLNQVLHC